MGEPVAGRDMTAVAERLGRATEAALRLPAPARLQACVEALVSELDAALARIWLLDAGALELELVASAGLYTHVDGGHARVRVGAFKIGRIAEEKLPHLTNDVANDPRVGDPAWAAREGLVSFAGYPLLLRDRLLGVVALFGRAPLDSRTLDALAAMSDRLAEGLEHGARRASSPASSPAVDAGPVDERSVDERSGDDARVKFLADAIPHQVWTARPDGRLDYVNSRVTDYFGRSSERILGEGWLDLVHPDDTERCVQVWTKSLTTGERYELEFRLWSDAERRYRWHMAVAVPRRDARGHITQWVGTNTDVDGRRRIEDTQRILLDAGRLLSVARDAVATLDEVARLCVPAIADWCILDLAAPDGTLVRAKIAHRGSAPAELAERLRPYATGRHQLHPGTTVFADGRPLFVEELTSAQLDSFAVDAEHAAILRELSPCSYVVAPMDAVGRRVGVLSLLTTAESGRRFGENEAAFAEELGRRAALALENARHYREAEEALVERERLIKALSASNQELQQFAAVVSHDLKAPLRGIANLAEWLDEGLTDKVDDEGRRFLALLRGRVRAMDALIDGILRYSRAGRLGAHLGPVPLGPLLLEVVELLAAPAGVIIDVPAVLPTLTAERALLEQVFLNLIGNAIKYGVPGGGRVEVRWTEHDDAHELVVRDHGPGIAPRHHERIWKMFQTIHTGADDRGSGIGLAVVRKIVEAHGGSVSLESQSGAGASFHVRWPKKVTPPARDG